MLLAPCWIYFSLGKILATSKGNIAQAQQEHRGRGNSEVPPYVIASFVFSFPLPSVTPLHPRHILPVAVTHGTLPGPAVSTISTLTPLATTLW